jgi:GDP-L-fucose synthase
MIGSALVRRLGSERCQILTVDRAALDLTRQADTERWIDNAKPDAVILAAAKVGDIAYNNANPVDFLADNLAIALNVIRASFAAGVQRRAISIAADRLDLIAVCTDYQRGAPTSESTL